MLTYKDSIEVEDVNDKIIGRATVTNTKTNLMGNLTNMFSFGKAKEPEVKIGKNEVKVVVFKRMPENKVIFAEGQ